MTVRDLIGELGGYDENAQVCVEDQDYTLYTIRGVDLQSFGDQPGIRESDPWYRKIVVRLKYLE
jgi:hypothetical protein